MARTDRDIDDHLKTSLLLWMFEVESLFGVALWEIKLNFVRLLMIVVEMMAMFMILMMMTNKSHLLFGEKRRRGQSHLEPSEDDCH